MMWDGFEDIFNNGYGFSEEAEQRIFAEAEGDFNFNIIEDSGDVLEEIDFPKLS